MSTTPQQPSMTPLAPAQQPVSAPWQPPRRSSFQPPLPIDVDCTVPPNRELAVVVDNDGPELEVELLKGQAEIKGFSLVLHTKMWFPAGFRFQIFSYQGCQVKLKGAVTQHTLQENPTMETQLKIHTLLNRCRDQARQLESDGPRLLVCGPTDNGKSSFCKFLINRAITDKFQPTFIELDVGQGDITLPGCLAFTTVTKPLHPVTLFDAANPYVIHYGGNSLMRDLTPYLKQMHQLKRAFQTMMNMSQEARHSGCVINTCGWVTGGGFECIVNAAMMFEVQIIACLGDDQKLYEMLRKVVPPAVQIIQMQKVPGIRVRPTHFRRRSRANKVHEYFHGPRGNFPGHRVVMKTADLKFYMFSECNTGGRGLGSPLPTQVIDAKTIPLDTIVSIMARDNSDESSVLGYLRLDVRDDEEGTCTFLARCPGPIPSTSFMCMRYTAGNA